MINVCIIDDSALVRRVVSEIIEGTSNMILTVKSSNPLLAIKKLRTERVDVIILDIEMPGMDGLTFLKKIRNVKPISVIVLSSLIDKNAEITLRAYKYGAFEVLKKPENTSDLVFLKECLIKTIQRAAVRNVQDSMLSRNVLLKANYHIPDNKKHNEPQKIIVIGSSTGGIGPLYDVLSKLPINTPGIIVVQHLPVHFSQGFAERLDSYLSLAVKLAENGEPVQKGTVYIAPGEYHCSIAVSNARYIIKLRDGPRINYHKPSVTALFNSIANYVKTNAIGIMLSGMGEDGAKAMRLMKDAGSYNIIQNEHTSVVWGMPGKVKEYGGESIILPSDKIAKEICRVLSIPNYV